MIVPRLLQKGDTIAVISPAGAVEREELSPTLSLIEQRGYKTVFGKNTLKVFENGYSYAGTPQERADDINWAIQNPEITAIWATRGGYGCQHLLEKIDLETFHKNPKWHIGYSDNTALQSLFLSKNIASIHGQTVKMPSFGVSQESYHEIFSILEGKLPSYTVAPHSFNRKGTAAGMLVGGNLALVYALLGTKYSFSFQDSILFIEEIGEQFYAIDRMLTSLELAGVFTQIKGLIIGGMTQCGNSNNNACYHHSFDEFAYELISQKVKDYHFPTVFGFPNGHIYHNLPLVIGAKTTLQVGNEVNIIQS